MEQCFRITLLMFLLIGYLQANPVPENKKGRRNLNIKNIGFQFLKEDVICGANVTFPSPTNVEEPCFNAACERFISGLEEAKNCSGEDRVYQALRPIRNWCSQNTTSSPPSQCNWDNEESRKPFPDFVEDMKTFVQSFNQKTKN